MNTNRARTSLAVKTLLLLAALLPLAAHTGAGQASAQEEALVRPKTEAVGEFKIHLELMNADALRVEQTADPSFNTEDVTVPNNTRLRLEVFRMYPTIYGLIDGKLRRTLVHTGPVTYKDGLDVLPVGIRETNQDPTPSYYEITLGVDSRQIRRELRDAFPQEVIDTLGAETRFFKGGYAPAMKLIASEIEAYEKQIQELKPAVDDFVAWYTPLYNTWKGLSPGDPALGPNLEAFLDGVIPKFSAIARFRSDSFHRFNHSVMKESHQIAFKVMTCYFAHLDGLAYSIVQSGQWRDPSDLDAAPFIHRQRLDCARGAALNILYYLNDMTACMDEKYAAFAAAPEDTAALRASLEADWVAAIDTADAAWRGIAEQYTKELFALISKECAASGSTSPDAATSKSYITDALPTMTESGLRGAVAEYIAAVRTIQSAQARVLPPPSVEEPLPVGSAKAELSEARKTAAKLQAKITELLNRPKDHIPTDEEIEKLGENLKR